MSLVLRNEMALPEIMTLGDVFKQSGYFRDVRDQAQAVVKILYGRELGFSPVVSMMGIHIIEGKPALSSNLLGALVKRSGKYNYSVGTLTDDVCVLNFTEDGKPAGESPFSIKDAQKAGVYRQGGSWSKYPRNMLFARALSNGVKMFCPELSACPVYFAEELGAEVNEEGEVTTLPKPKTVQSVAVTEEDEIILPKSAAGNRPSGDGELEKRVSTPSPAAAETEFAAMAEEVHRTEPPPVQYIDMGRQKNLHIEWRKAIRKDFTGDKDFSFYDWLLANGYVDMQKVPTAGAIPMAEFDEVKRKMLQKARSL